MKHARGLRLRSNSHSVLHSTGISFPPRGINHGLFPVRPGKQTAVVRKLNDVSPVALVRTSIIRRASRNDVRFLLFVSLYAFVNYLEITPRRNLDVYSSIRTKLRVMELRFFRNTDRTCNTKPRFIRTSSFRTAKFEIRIAESLKS